MLFNNLLQNVTAGRCRSLISITPRYKGTRERVPRKRNKKTIFFPFVCLFARRSKFFQILHFASTRSIWSKNRGNWSYPRDFPAVCILRPLAPDLARPGPGAGGWAGAWPAEHLKDMKQQAIYGVVHGGTDRDLRALSASYVSSLPVDGFAVGGRLLIS